MKLDYTPAAVYALDKAAARIRKTFYKQVASLRAKKYDEKNDLWQARVNDDWRFYFRMYRIEEIRKHPK